MRTATKTAFRPHLESIEARIVATAGVASAAVPHPAAAHPVHHQAAANPPVHAESTPAVHAAKHAAKPQAKPAAPPRDTASTQAWIELVNMTGQDLQYQVKLGPYANGRFLTFDIGAGQSQYRMSSLLVNGRREKANFAIQFGNGPVTPLMTGISQQSAKGYYIFFDGNFQPYVAPFVRS